MLDRYPINSASSIAQAIELVTADITNPTELNALGTAVEDLRLVHENVAGSDRATLYRLDTSSDSVVAPYIMASLTAGLRWVAIAGYAVNQAVRLASTLAVGAGLTVTSNTTLSGTLSATGAVALGSGLTVASNAVVSGTFSAVGATALGAGLTVSSNVTISGTASVVGSAVITGVFTAANTTDATSSTAAGTIVSGGLAVAKTVWAGTGFAFGEAPSAAANVYTALATVNGGLYYRVKNGSNGASAQADFRAFNDGDQYIQFGIASSGKTTYGTLVANAAFLYCINAAGLTLMVDNASGPITFSSGGKNEAGRFSSAKNLLIGTTSDGGLTGSGGLSVASTTDATASGSAAVVVSGGQSVSKTLIHAKGRGAGVTSTATAAGTTTLTSTSTEVQTFTGSTTQTVQFPAANLFGAGIAVIYTINNQSSGTVTSQRAGSDTFQGGGTTDAVLAGASTTYMSNGVSVWLKC